MTQFYNNHYKMDGCPENSLKAGVGNMLKQVIDSKHNDMSWQQRIEYMEEISKTIVKLEHYKPEILDLIFNNLQGSIKLYLLRSLDREFLANYLMGNEDGSN